MWHGSTTLRRVAQSVETARGVPSERAVSIRFAARLASFTARCSSAFVSSVTPIQSSPVQSSAVRCGAMQRGARVVQRRATPLRRRCSVVAARCTVQLRQGQCSAAWIIISYVTVQWSTVQQFIRGARVRNTNTNL